MTRFPTTPSFDLTGKHALVVGATSGIGFGAATALAAAGAHVTLSARTRSNLERVAGHMVEQGWMADILAMDITDVGATAQAVADNGPFDILMNSAGQARHTLATQTTPDDFDAVMDVNLRGAYFLTQAVAKGLLAAGKPGSLINIASQMAHVGGLDRAAYCASKFAVEGFTKAMAIEWGPRKIRVNTICPTFVLTPLTKPTFDDPQKRQWIERMIKLGRPAEVEDIMGMVLYLASDASAMVTGASMLIDGGWTAD